MSIVVAPFCFACLILRLVSIIHIHKLRFRWRFWSRPSRSEKASLLYLFYWIFVGFHLTFTNTLSKDCLEGFPYRVAVAEYGFGIFLNCLIYYFRFQEIDSRFRFVTATMSFFYLSGAGIVFLASLISSVLIINAHSSETNECTPILPFFMSIVFLIGNTLLLISGCFLYLKPFFSTSLSNPFRQLLFRSLQAVTLSVCSSATYQVFLMIMLAGNNFNSYVWAIGPVDVFVNSLAINLTYGDFTTLKKTYRKCCSRKIGPITIAVNSSQDPYH